MISEDIVAIIPAEFSKAQAKLGWDSIIGCTVNHTKFGPGVIQSVDELIHIQLLNDPDGREERRFYTTIFTDGIAEDLEIPFHLAKSIELILGHKIALMDPGVARKRRDMLSRLRGFDFKGANEIFNEILDCLNAKEIDNYNAIRTECELSYQQEQQRELLQTTLEEIDNVLHRGQFENVELLYEKIALIFPRDEFEQKVITARIRYEFFCFNFPEADGWLEGTRKFPR